MNKNKGIILTMLLLIVIYPVSIIFADPVIVTETFKSTKSLISVIATKTHENITMICGITAVIGAITSGGGAYSRLISAIGVGSVAFILVTIFKVTCTA